MKKQIKKRIFNGIIIPLCAFLLIIGSFKMNASASKDGSSGDENKRISVVTTPSGMMSFEDGIETFGNVESKNFALVSARIPGVIDDIYVEEGDHVTAGQTRLFQTDRVKATQAVEIARQAVSVAEFTHRAKLASADRAVADFEKAGVDYERFRRLYENDGAVTKNAFESQETRFKQLKASLEEARANADLAERQTEQARSNLIIASKDLEDSLVQTPLTGYVSARYKEPGEMAGAGTPVLRIDNPSILEISAFLPAEYYPRIMAGKTIMHAYVNEIDLGEITITYRSPTIDNRLRNFEVKALINNPPDGVASGAMARIKVVLGRHKALGVPRKALLKRTSGEIIFLAEGGKARIISVKTGLQMNGWVEIISGDIKEGASIITMGQDQLDDGSLISVLREDKN
ncbi:MAG: efflux RND transporter periplasmic adaptor subunit [Deltaproteobacteria bacterium]|nr:efflux RND transporter periplasmic adaptor subunit [Deltaproteobacteria bacterium]